MRNEKGSALVIVLVISLVLLSSTGLFVKYSKEIVNKISDIESKLDTKINSLSLLEKAKFTLSTSPFFESYVKNVLSVDPFPSKINLYGKTIKTSLGDIRFTDTSSKINALYLNRHQIQRLIKNDKLSYIAYDSLKDWIDKDNLKRLNGAEYYFYRLEKGYKYSPRNSQAIQDKEELRNIRGFFNVYDIIEENLVFSYKGSVLNINTASDKMLSIVLSIPPDIANQVVKLRDRKGSISFLDVARLTGKDPSIFVDYYSTFPSKVVIIDILSKKKNAQEKLRAIIDFNVNEDYPYTVIKYIE